MIQPVALALDIAGNRAFVTDADGRRVFQIDLDSGDRTIVADRVRFEDIAFNPSNRTVLVADGNRSTLKLFAIDPETGTRTTVFDASAVPGPTVLFLTALALDLSFNRAIVVSGNSGDVFGVDLSTGSISLITNRDSESSAYGSFFVDLEVRDGTAYMLDRSQRSVVRVNLVTGQQVTISTGGLGVDLAVGSGPAFEFPRGIALDDLGNRALVMEDFLADALIGVDLNTGDRSLVSDGRVGSGINLTSPRGLAMSHDPVRLFAVDLNGDFGVEFDTSNGDRRLIFGSPSGRGTIDSAPTGVAIDVDAGSLFYVDGAADALLKVDLNGGDPVVISGAGRGSGPVFPNPVDIVLDSTRHIAYVLDASRDALVSVDLSTGDRATVSGMGIGVGEPFGSPVAVVLDAERYRAFVSDSSSDSVYEVNLLNGDRVVVSGNRVGTGSGIRILGDIALDEANGRLLALDTGRKNIVAIDLESGDREIVSGDASLLLGVTDPDGSLRLVDVPRHVGDGSLFADPSHIEVSAAGSIAYVLDNGYDGLLAVELHTGNRQLISK